MPARNKLINIFVGLICLTLSINIIRSWIFLSQRGNIVQQAQTRLDDVQTTNENLTRRLAQVKNPVYIEKQAREKLNLSREGEITLLLPTISPITQITPMIEDRRSNWEKWWNVFIQ